MERVVVTEFEQDEIQLTLIEERKTIEIPGHPPMEIVTNVNLSVKKKV